MITTSYAIFLQEKEDNMSPVRSAFAAFEGHKWQKVLWTVISSAYFDMAMGVVIIFNSANIGNPLLQYDSPHQTSEQALFCSWHA
eukprot:4694419-Amphidinium_carterae.1